MKETKEQARDNWDYQSFNAGVGWCQNAIKELMQREDLLKIDLYNGKERNIPYDRITIQLIDGELWAVAHENGWHENDTEDQIDTLDNLLKKA